MRVSMHQICLPPWANNSLFHPRRQAAFYKPLVASASHFVPDARSGLLASSVASYQSRTSGRQGGHPSAIQRVMSLRRHRTLRPIRTACGALPLATWRCQLRSPTPAMSAAAVAFRSSAMGEGLLRSFFMASPWLRSQEKAPSGATQCSWTSQGDSLHGPPKKFLGRC